MDCVGEKRVASLRSVGPGAVEGVMAWRKAQLKGMPMCVTESLLVAVEANQDSGVLWRSRECGVRRRCKS